MRRIDLVFVTIVAFSVLGCEPNDTPQFSFYDDQIGPILTNSCTRQNIGCHIPRADGTALGNLDLTSYDALARRRDVLEPFGPYSTSLLLLKAGEPVTVQVETFDPDPMRRRIPITTDIRHNAGTTVDLGSSAYARIKQWIDAGYTRTGVFDETLVENIGPCRTDPARAPVRGFDPSTGMTDASWSSFGVVEEALVRRCAGSSCHGSPIADLYLTCSDNGGPASRANYLAALAHVNTPASTSELLRRPLSNYRGGVFHEGGNVFGSVDDPDYQILRTWAEDIVARAPELLDPPAGLSRGELFFANRVQPMLVRKGCMFLNCHSTAMFHDLRLRGGAEGLFSRVATLHNYEISRLLLAPDASDPNESRIIAKNLYPPEQVTGAQGIFHRGGSLLEDFGQAADGSPNPATAEDCAGVDADNGDLNTIPAYCVLRRWHEIEREEGIAAGELFPAGDVVRAVFWISRGRGVGEARDFDTYRAGADLVRATASVDPGTGDLSIGASASVLAACGLSAATADIRGLAVSWDGARVAFGARSSGSAPLRLYEMSSDGTGCAPIAGIAASMDRQNDILTHDFDPAYAPDGRLVFASTRGNSDAAILGVAGPTSTPAAGQPNANLYIRDEGGQVRQLTYLLNQELQPSFMTDGRVIFTAEKYAEDFHQLAGRRENLDGGDYHPLFAQRGSVGFAAGTEIVEMLDRNLVIVAADVGAVDGAGQLVIVNRSIGPDQADRDPADRNYIASSRRVGPEGVRSPAPLPTGRLLASCDQGGGDFQLCEIDPDSGAVRVLGGSAGQADIEPVPVFARSHREVFVSRIDEANAHTRVEPGAFDAEVQVTDFPMLATLLFSNTRTSRPIDYRIGGFNVYAELPPMPGAAPGARRLNALGFVPINADGSARIRYRGGVPIVLEVADAVGAPL
ncbi:MAG: hypothetical protein K8H88_08215, partial [Sandaracinaceae bacterium]|nr:hypothetical protein [Sandaracinaceae bacterium]